MKSFTILYGLMLISTVFAFSGLDYNILAPRSGGNSGLNVKNADIDAPRPLLPRTSQAPAPSPSPSPEHGTRHSNRANQGLPLPTMRPGPGQRSPPHSREGEASVNSSPARERPQSPNNRRPSGHGNLSGSMLAGERSVSRPRQAQIHGERNPIQPAAQQNTGPARSQAVQNENERYRAAVQRFAQRWNVPLRDRGLPHRPNLPDPTAKQHAVTQQLVRDAASPWAAPGINSGRPDPISPDHPINIMPGMAQRVARGPMRPPNNREPAERGVGRGHALAGQAGRNVEWGASFADIFDANQGRGRGQGQGRGRGQAQQQGGLPDPPPSPSTTSEQDQYHPPPENRSP